MNVDGIDKKLQREYDRKNHTYSVLVEDIQNMIESGGRGQEVAHELNEEFWEELSAHKQRMEEQIARLRNVNPSDFAKEYESADTIYEAARNYLAKYGIEK
ncbi:MAG: hypothetical protein R3275_05980 [Saprospiraceae bacterium]|nr:hypothetical protein [Saprospiraceae bacterium]